MHHFDNIPPVPLTIEGASILHQMLRVRWPEWRALTADSRADILQQAGPALAALEANGSAVFSLLGHKGDLMVVHFRQSFEELGAVERTLAHLRLWDYVEQASSY